MTSRLAARTILNSNSACFKLYKIFQDNFYIILNIKWFLIHIKLSNREKRRSIYTLIMNFKSEIPLLNFR